jgi:hypothetical protein
MLAMDGKRAWPVGCHTPEMTSPFAWEQPIPYSCPLLHFIFMCLLLSHTCFCPTEANLAAKLCCGPRNDITTRIIATDFLLVFHWRFVFTCDPFKGIRVYVYAGNDEKASRPPGYITDQNGHHMMWLLAGERPTSYNATLTLFVYQWSFRR